MATTRHSNKSRSSNTKTASAKAETPKLTAAEYRAQLGPNLSKQEKIEIDDRKIYDLFKGTPEDIARQIRDYAKSKGITGRFEIGRIRVVQGRSYYKSTVTKWGFVIERPYTDEELEKEGPKLLKQKEKLDQKAAEKRRKEIEAFNRMATKLGQPTISE